MNWPSPTRLKRLASLHPTITTRWIVGISTSWVATLNRQVVGVAAWDSATSQTLPNGPGGLFHGLYVLPLIQRQGVGKGLMATVFEDARCHQVNGLLVKAQRISREYFAYQGMQALLFNEAEYPWRYWKDLA